MLQKNIFFLKKEKKLIIDI